VSKDAGRMLSSLCVFAGSSHGRLAAYAEAATGMGRLLASRGIALVFGGGHVGLMGKVADGCLAAGGTVTGVIPRSMVERELAHRGLSELHVVSSMHERKARMAELADGFIALPGGVGTLEETFEVWTWAQLGHHAKPVGMLNVAGYYEPLISFFERMVDHGFIRPEHKRMLHVADNAATLIAAMERHEPVATPKWIERGET